MAVPLVVLLGNLFIYPLCAEPGRAQVPVSFQLRIQGNAALQPRGKLWLRPLARPDERLVFDVEDSTTVKAVLPAAGDWELALILDEFWAPRAIFSVSESQVGATQTVDVWPTGLLEGLVQLKDSTAELPRQIKVQFESPTAVPPEKKVPAGAVFCPVGEEGRWSCQLPAGTLDLTLRARSFVPHYRWGIPVESGRRRDLGVFKLTRGASLTGWVEVEEGALEPSECTLTISLLQAPGGQREKAVRMERVSVEARVDERGFFQAGPVAPGSYLLEAEQPGYAPARLYPVDLWQDVETVLRAPLILKRPVRLRLQLDPPTDWLGEPWRVEVLRASDYSAGFDEAPVFSGSATSTGRVTVAGQAPGTFWVRVSDSPGNRVFSDSAWQVTDQAGAARLIEIELLTLTGTVTLGEEPLESFLLFGGRSGAVRMEMAADSEGEFEGILPRGGAWPVEILAIDGSVQTYTEVEVVPDQTGNAEVEIRLPDTHLLGKVVDEEGEPVAEASVTVAGREGDIGLRTDLQGAFQLRAAPEGPAQLRARLGLRDQVLTSEAVLVHLLDGQTTGPVVLTLQANKAVRGKVVSRIGPVAGATVDLLAVDPPLPFGTSVRTGLDGRFSAPVPQSARLLTGVVSPPGHALRAFEVPAQGEPVSLRVPKEGGSLELLVPYSLEEARSRAVEMLVFQDHLSLPLGALARWARGHGGQFFHGPHFEIPAMASAQYRACLVRRQVVADGEARPGASDDAACTSGYLAAGSILRLELPRFDE